LALLALFFLLYGYFGPYFGGILKHAGYFFTDIIDITVFTERGILTIPIGICSTYIILFLIFAGLVQISGATEFFTQFALSLAGKAKGGPAKVAVIGSSFIGSITGNAAANVAITGAVSIPMMKRAGFAPYFAGGVEAAASKGGHILPPVMAGTAFIMADFLGVTYWDVCVAAFIPALLYFLGVFLQVHFYSVRNDLTGVEGEDIPRFWQTLKGGWQHFVPFIVLIGLLARGYSPIWAALWSLPVVIGASWVRKETRIGLKKFLRGLSFSIKAIRLIMLATALSGIIMGMVMYSGLGTRLMTSIASFSQDRLIVALCLAAAVSFLLGLTLSMVASYILTAILIVPAAVKLGVAPMAAHLFSFYFASVATITPPVGGVFYQAAALAESPPFKTGWAATRLAIAAFIVPVFFVYHPGLLFAGPIADILIAVLFTTIAVACVAVALEGWLIAELSIPGRVILVIAGCLLIVMKPLVVLLCMIIIGAVAFSQQRKRRRAQAVI
jgi:TRAP transporter 4TM/12TM fusion protein